LPVAGGEWKMEPESEWPDMRANAHADARAHGAAVPARSRDPVRAAESLATA